MRAYRVVCVFFSICFSTVILDDSEKITDICYFLVSSRLKLLRFICWWFYSIIEWSVAVPTFSVSNVFDFGDVSDDGIGSIFCVVLE